MKIRLRLTILMLSIGLFPLIVVSVIAAATLGNELTRKSQEQVSSVALKQEQKINSLLQRNQEEAVKLANRYDVQVASGEYIATHSAVSQHSIEEVLRTKKSDLSEVASLHVTNLNNVVIASTSKQEGSKMTDQINSTQPGQESVISVREDSDGIDKLFVTTKISVNKVDVAALHAIFKLDDILAAVQDYTGLGNSGETIVAAQDSSGKAVSLFPLRFNTEAALKTKLDSLNLFSKSYSLQSNIKDYRGHNVIIVSTYTGFAGWVVASKIDQNEALAPIGRLQNILVVILGISSIATLLGAFWLARLITGPIIKITHISERIGKGDFRTLIDIHRSDELGVLGQSINTMASSLSTLVANIEYQRNRLEVILNSTAEGIMAIDHQNRIIIANRATSTLTRLPIDQVTGKKIDEIFDWKKDGESVGINYDTAGTNIYQTLEYKNIHGEQLYLKLIVVGLDTYGDQSTTKAIVTLHDETKSRELENMKLDFVSMAAHELRTPLAATRGYLELITHRNKDQKEIKPEEAQRYLRQAIKSTIDLGTLINNLLDVTRIERGTLTINISSVDLAAEVKQSVEDIDFSARDKDIRVSYNGLSSAPVAGDPIALREVINNLLSNAIKYTGMDGTVAVSLEEKLGKSYLLQVKDSGIGIPESALSKLFTKFFRVHGGLNSGSTGTGLGLFISKSIIERLGGTISVSSVEGEGSTFSVELPRLDKQALAAIQAQEAKSTTRRHRGWITQNIAR